jgi:hypothetical protein
VAHQHRGLMARPASAAPRLRGIPLPTGLLGEQGGPLRSPSLMRDCSARGLQGRACCAWGAGWRRRAPHVEARRPEAPWFEEAAALQRPATSDQPPATSDQRPATSRLGHPAARQARSERRSFAPVANRRGAGWGVHGRSPRCMAGREARRVGSGLARRQPGWRLGVGHVGAGGPNGSPLRGVAPVGRRRAGCDSGPWGVGRLKLERADKVFWCCFRIMKEVC